MGPHRRRPAAVRLLQPAAGAVHRVRQHPHRRRPAARRPAVQHVLPQAPGLVPALHRVRDHRAPLPSRPVHPLRLPPAPSRPAVPRSRQPSPARRDDLPRAGRQRPRPLDALAGQRLCRPGDPRRDQPRQPAARTRHARPPPAQPCRPPPAHHPGGRRRPARPGRAPRRPRTVDRAHHRADRRSRRAADRPQLRGLASPAAAPPPVRPAPHHRRAGRPRATPDPGSGPADQLAAQHRHHPGHLHPARHRHLARHRDNQLLPRACLRSLGHRTQPHPRPGHTRARPQRPDHPDRRGPPVGTGPRPPPRRQPRHPRTG